ncbi:DMT family transporter [Pseudovibrio sp. Tun.PSC04-5.I4]|uniref:DMT family transporter n=1 Tax=Pseudovibrio sp. Tun.PSC04-5.I4 TaxID=1798213 RepID=UPI000887658C|nr:DMT family transporter [Pseudovibrio sp. Tun.PSC04-5.I4]SDR34619.1 Threonine/homoserine efflux transporter RhtA [Pseudovibrio sp. Tun.PSC04-5.I4]
MKYIFEMTRASANILLLMAGLIWGIAFVTQSTAMESLGPLQFTAMRFLLAALVVIPFALRERRVHSTRKISKAHWPMIFIVCVSFTLGTVLQQFGMLVTSVTNAGFLTAVYVVLTPILVKVFFKGHPNFLVWPASIITLLGIYLLGGGLTTLNMGDAFMLICAFFWALQMIYMGKAATSSGRPIAIAALQFTFIGVVTLIISFFYETYTLQAIQDAWFEIFFAGALSGGVAFTFQAFAQQWTTPSDAAIMLSSEALFAALAAAFFLGERLPFAGIFGCALIFGSILLVEVGPHFIKFRRTPVPE